MRSAFSTPLGKAGGLFDDRDDCFRNVRGVSRTLYELRQEPLPDPEPFPMMDRSFRPEPELSCDLDRGISRPRDRELLSFSEMPGLGRVLPELDLSRTSRWQDEEPPWRGEYRIPEYRIYDPVQARQSRWENGESFCLPRVPPLDDPPFLSFKESLPEIPAVDRWDTLVFPVPAFEVINQRDLLGPEDEYDLLPSPDRYGWTPTRARSSSARTGQRNARPAPSAKRATEGFKWTVEQARRLALEKKLLQKELPEFELHEPKGLTYVAGEVSSRHFRNKYKLIVRLTQRFPEEAPDLFVASPTPLKQYDGRSTLPEASHSFHTGCRSEENYDKICYVSSAAWSASITIAAILTRGVIWLCMYEEHLRTGKTIESAYVEKERSMRNEH